MKRIMVMTVAAIAASVCLASVGVSTASAEPTVLCKKSEEACKYENLIPEGTTITAETKESSDKVKIQTQGVTIKCPSKLEATVGSSSGNDRLLSVTSWKLGNSSEWCTAFAKNDCGQSNEESLPWSAQATWPNNESIYVSGPRWHLHCSVAGSTFLDCTFYEEQTEARFNFDHNAFVYTGYPISQEGYACQEQAYLSATLRITKPESPIYVAASGPAAPHVVTGAANHITAKGATLAGTVNPEGAPTKYWFEYGKTTAYGTKVPVSAEEVGTGFSSVAVSQTIGSLSNNTTYHFQLFAENPLGKAEGGDKTFYVGAPIYRSSFGSTKFGHPAGIDFDSSGNLWVADEEKSQLEHWSTSGSLLSSLPIYSNPTSVAVDSEDNVWVAEKEHARLVEVSPKPEVINVIGEGELATPEAIATDAQDDIWVADPGNNVVKEFDSEGNLMETIEGGEGSEGGFSEPTGVAVAPSGTVFIADQGTDRVLGYSQSGVLLSEWGPVISMSAGIFLIEPTSLAVDSEGNVWVTAESDNRVLEFTESGEYITRFGGTGTGNGQFNFARAGGIAVDSQFNVWVSDQGNHLVKKFSR